MSADPVLDMLLRIEVPTDAQLGYLAQLCRENGFPVAVVYSKQDASITIDEIRAGTYEPPEWDDAIPF
jgi:hypothetical protein